MIAIIDLGSEDTDFLVKTIESSRQKFKVTTNETEILRSDKVILSISEDAEAASRKIHILNLFTILRICQRPLLGIFNGMQLLVDHSAEGDISCLGIFPVSSENFECPLNKVPYKGMHSITIKKSSLLFKNVQDGECFYFSNSYYIPVNEHTTSVADNNLKFSASLEKGNFYGIQFLPEKSGEAGLKVMQNFIELPVK